MDEDGNYPTMKSTYEMIRNLEDSFKKVHEKDRRRFLDDMLLYHAWTVSDKHEHEDTKPLREYMKNMYGLSSRTFFEYYCRLSQLDAKISKYGLLRNGGEKDT